MIVFHLVYQHTSMQIDTEIPSKTSMFGMKRAEIHYIEYKGKEREREAELYRRHVNASTC
jgi:hypothetical protein